MCSSLVIAWSGLWCVTLGYTSLYVLGNKKLTEFVADNNGIKQTNNEPCETNYYSYSVSLRIYIQV